MQRETNPSEPQQHLQSRRTFATIISLPLVLVIGTVLLVALWALLTLSVIFALLLCAALVAIGLPVCLLLARRSWRRRFPPPQT